MESYSRGDVVKVPFPYTDRAVRRWRPALVVSGARLHDVHGLAWVVMITSAENRGWPDDVVVRDLAAAGLPAPSVVRPAKIATIESAAAEKIGAVSGSVLAQIMKRVGRLLDDE
ncbi:MAG: type II toxin-antitoxin system PemK/MazF family toxin [Steroidobacteraceae bacterium]